MDKLYQFSDLIARSTLDPGEGHHRSGAHGDALYERYKSAGGSVRAIVSAVTTVGLVFVAIAQWVH